MAGEARSARFVSPLVWYCNKASGGSAEAHASVECIFVGSAYTKAMKSKRINFNTIF